MILSCKISFLDVFVAKVSSIVKTKNSTTLVIHGRRKRKSTMLDKVR